MTISQWLRHIRHWFGTFPLKRDDSHLWISLAGEEYFTCYCGAEHDENPIGHSVILRRRVRHSPPLLLTNSHRLRVDSTIYSNQLTRSWRTTTRYPQSIMDSDLRYPKKRVR